MINADNLHVIRRILAKAAHEICTIEEDVIKVLRTEPIEGKKK